MRNLVSQSWWALVVAWGLLSCGSTPAATARPLSERFPLEASTLAQGPRFERTAQGFAVPSAGAGDALAAARASLAARAQVKARFPLTAEAPLQLTLPGGAVVQVRELGARGDRALEGGTVRTPLEGGATRWAQTGAGVESWVEALEAGEGPVAQYEVSGARVSVEGATAWLLGEQGQRLARVTAPTARTREGQPRRAWLTAAGQVLSLHTEARGHVLVDPLWSPTGALAGERAQGTTTLLPDGRVLVTGGGLNTPQATCELYDPSTGAWSPAAPMVHTRVRHTATLLLDGRVLVVGGSSVGGLDFPVEAELYDPATGSWANTTGLLPGGREMHTATRLDDGRVLVVGGAFSTLAGRTFRDDAALFDPMTGTFTATAVMPAGPRWEHTASLLSNGQVLVAGGGASGGVSQAGTTQLFDPLAGTWAAGPALQGLRALHVAVTLPNGKVLLAGGVGDTGDVGALELYTPGAATTTLLPATLSPRHALTGTLLPSGKVLLTGGVTAGASQSTAELFDAQANTVTAAPALGVARESHGAVLLPGGRVLLVGGTSLTARSSSETYEPGTPAWFAGLDGSVARQGPRAVLLLSGKVLVTGGLYLDGTGAARSSNVAELYDPVNDSWQLAAPMKERRDSFTLTLLANGTVLAAGGQDYQGVGPWVPGTSEIYEPTTNTWTMVGPQAVPRLQHAAALLPDGRVLVVGGSAGSATELFDPVARTWSPARALASARTNPLAVPLLDGRVLVMGGEVSGTPIGGAQIFNPATDRWVTAAAPNEPRRDAVAALLMSGRVLFTGGSNPSWTRTAELYDPVADTWTYTTNLPTERAAAGSLLLATGEVMVSGGQGIPGLSNTASLYDPASASWREVVVPNGGASLTGPVFHADVLSPQGLPLVFGGSSFSPGSYSRGIAWLDLGRGEKVATAPTLVTVPTVAVAGGALAVTGTTLRGVSTASDGATGSSAHNVPVLHLRSATSERQLWLRTTSASASAVSAALPAGLLPGWYWVRVAVNGALSAAVPTKVLGPPIIAGPPSVPPRGVADFTASGGTGTGYAWSMVTSNSGGTISPTGHYVAGATPLATDTVRVTDSGSFTVTATISTTAGVSLTTIPNNATSAPPLGTIDFFPSGGSGLGYGFTLKAGGSGGSCTAAGHYVAGPTGSTTDEVTATDSLGNTAKAVVTVTAGVSLSPAAPSLPPRGAQAFTASGGTGQGYAFTLTSASSGGTITPAGAYTAGATGGVSDVVHVTDSLGNQATTTVGVTPGVSLTPASLTVAPLGTATFSADGGAGAPFTWSLDAGSHAATLSSTGAYQAGRHGNAVDVATVSDGLGNSAAVAITVTAGAFVAPTAPAIAPRGQVAFTASGVAGAVYTWSVASLDGGPAHGTVSGAGVYAAGDGGSVTDVVTVLDLDANAASTPVSTTASLALAPATAAVSPREALQFTAAAGSGAGYAFSLATNGSGATLGATSGAYRAGTTPFSTDVVRVVDDLGNAAEATVSVGATFAVSAAPTSVPPRGTVTLTPVGGVAGALSWTVIANLSGATAGPHATLPRAGTYVAGSTGGVTDTVEVRDLAGNTATADIAVGPGLSITPANGTLAPGGTRQLTCAGGSGGGYGWAAVGTPPSGGAFTSTPGLYRAGSTGSVTDQVRCTDALGNTATLDLTIGPGLAFVPASVSLVPLDSRQLQASGGGGPPYTFSLVTTPSPLGLVSTSGLYRAPALEGVDTVRVVDANGNTATTTITVTGALSITPAQLSLPPLGSMVFSGSGGSGTGYGYALSTNGSGATFDALTSTYTAGPQPGTVDRLTLHDSLGNTATATIRVGAGVTVTPAAATVVPGAGQAFVATGGVGAPYTWAMEQAPSGGHVDATGHYVAGHGAHVTDVVRARDGLGNVATVSVQVGDGVTITPATPSVPPRATVALAAAGGSGQAFVWRMVSAPSGGTVRADTGEYTAGLTGGVSDVVGVTDSLQNEATVSLTVTGGVVVDPAEPTVPPRGAVAFAASGGRGAPYSWALRNQGSGVGAHLTGTGAYTAGALGGAIDVVVATDALGNEREARVHTGPGVSLSPTAPIVAPLEAVDFAAQGGSDAGFHWNLTAATSGGTVDEATGHYVAGRRPGVDDTLRVTDSLGNEAQVVIKVQAPLVISPAAPRVVPGATLTFTASGGTESGYHWRLASAPSGGTVDPASGFYAAGPTGGTRDLLEVTDEGGRVASTTIEVLDVGGGSVDAGHVAPQDRAPVAGWSCGCGATGGGSGAWTLGLALLALLSSRRRRGVALGAAALAFAMGSAQAAPKVGGGTFTVKTKSGTTSITTGKSKGAAPVEKAPPPDAEPPAAVAPPPVEAAPRPKEKPAVAVLDVGVSVPGEKLDATAFSEALVASIDGSHQFRVISSKEIATLLGIEQQKSLSGCDDGGACMAELANALGSNFVLQANVGKVGSAYLVTCKLIDGKQAKVVARASLQATTPNRLLEAVWRTSQEVLDAYGAGLPPPEAAAFAARPRQSPPVSLDEGPAASPGTGLGLAVGVVGGYQPFSSPGHRGSVGAEAALTLRVERLELQVGAIIAPSPGARLAVGWAVVAGEVVRVTAALRGSLYPGLGLLGGGPAVLGEYALSPRFGLTAVLAADVFPTPDLLLVSGLAGVGAAAHF